MFRLSKISFLCAWALVAWGCDGGSGNSTATGGAGGAGGVTMGGAGGSQGMALEGLLEIRVALPGVKPILPGTPKNFVATGVFEDGTERDLSSEVTWQSSDDGIVLFEGDPRANFAAVPGDGRVTVTASMGPISGDLSTCTYPADFSPYLRSIKAEGSGECPCDLPAPIPYVYWENAHFPGGQVKPLRFGELHCDESVSIMIFVVGTTWCGACTSYAQRIAEISDEIEAAGGKIIFIELEDDNHNPCTSEVADRHLSNYIGDVGIRVGDADTRPGGGGYMASSGVVRAYPTVLIVRRSDMRIIADDTTGARDLDLAEVARNPDRDWTAPSPPMVESNCGGQEEDSEPNNSPAQAENLSMGSRDGGVCDGYPDFYQVNEQGPWKLTINFDHGVGDLDVSVWDVSSEGPMRDGAGEVVGSSTQESIESFEYQGPALVRISGFRYASAPYQLTLESR
jgi:thiol-disulfide isomerase/thioredoxin